MNSEAYNEWIGLFHEDFTKVWQKEQKELQRITLLSYAFQKELNNLRKNVVEEMSSLKELLKCKQELEKKTKSLSPDIGKKKSPSTVNKENDPECNKPTLIKKKQAERGSPDLFRDIDLNAYCSSTDLSVIDLSISEDDATSIDGSPTIKKRRKRFKFVPNPPAFSIITETEEKPVTPLSSTRDCVKTKLFKTPTTKSDHEVSVIEGTPQLSARKSKTISRVGENLSKRKFKNTRGHNSTLTQMFRNASMKKRKQKTEDGADSDETYFEDNSSTSKMGITDLIAYINKTDGKEQEKSLSSNISRGEGESSFAEINTSSQDVDEFSKGTIFNEEDLQTSIEKPKETDIRPEPVVRGKARKQLHGWSCQECKDFYDQMKLPAEEIQKKMDECSRHRYKYRPPEDTLPGFWDLSIPPEN